ncbi:PilZ domain-containing protein [Marinicella gelatinilytica]|uniref:PilZ domain-containing protein n=1 Tax=Marinicella gelatinilytica TaxID=2996017 RepID=UPI0022609F87|nr:PilZ domain-containing protein [Marinicella gelatinilytica]MCX7546022.1 PilZ domain-containing protein [Marinicella gelatinilytica]
MTDYSEKRQFTRIALSKEVTLYSGVSCWQSHIHDISLKGVLLACPDDYVVKMGDIFRLQIPLENSPSIIMNIRAVHVRDDSFGAEWTQIDMDSFAILKRTIEMNLSKKDALRSDIKSLSAKKS